MVVVLKDSQLIELQQQLKDHQGSEKMCGELALKLRDTDCDYEIVVNNWPNVTAVVLRSRGETDESQAYRVNLYATDICALKDLLKSPGVIDWSPRMIFPNVISELVPVVKEVLIEQQIPFDVSLQCILLKATREKLKIWPIPEGFKLCSLKPEQCDLVDNFWTYGRDEVPTPRIKHWIETLPNYCLYNKEGDIVGYVLQKDNGFLGPLYVLEKHRGHGYGKILMSHLAERCLQTMAYACVAILTDNRVSIKVHEDVGFDKIGTCLWIHC